MARRQRYNPTGLEDLPYDVQNEIARLTGPGGTRAQRQTSERLRSSLPPAPTPLGAPRRVFDSVAQHLSAEDMATLALADRSVRMRTDCPQVTSPADCFNAPPLCRRKCHKWLPEIVMMGLYDIFRVKRVSFRLGETTYTMNGDFGQGSFLFNDEGQDLGGDVLMFRNENGTIDVDDNVDDGPFIPLRASPRAADYDRWVMGVKTFVERPQSTLHLLGQAFPDLVFQPYQTQFEIDQVAIPYKREDGWEGQVGNVRRSAFVSDVQFDNPKAQVVYDSLFRRFRPVVRGFRDGDSVSLYLLSFATEIQPEDLETLLNNITQ